jgi:hypothetical protein
MPTGAKIEIEDPGDTEGCDSGAESSSVTRRAAFGHDSRYDCWPFGRQSCRPTPHVPKEFRA